MTRRPMRWMIFGLAAGLWASGLLASEPLDPGWSVLLQGGDLVKAEADLRQRAEKEPKDAAASFGLALLQQAQGQREKAVVTAVEGLKSAPGSPLACLLQDMVSQDATFNLATTRLVADSIPLLTAETGMDPLVRLELRWAAYQLAARQKDAEARRAAKKAAGFIPGAFFSDPEIELSRTRFYETSPAEKGNLKAHRWTYGAPEGIDVRPTAFAMPPDREANVLILVPFRVKEPGTALLYFNGSKCFRAALDDAPLFTKDVFKVQENPTVVRKVLLSAGYHRLVVKMHAGQAGDGLHIAFLDREGNPLAAEFLKDAAPSEEKPAGFKDEGQFLGFFRRRFRRRTRGGRASTPSGRSGWATPPARASTWRTLRKPRPRAWPGTS